MIKSFADKGLKQFYVSGKTAKLKLQKKGKRIGAMLDALDAATAPADLDLPGFRFHGLEGKPKRYSVTVSGNWRLTFGWNDGDAIDVKLEDYH